jgi:hypothetical protein
LRLLVFLEFLLKGGFDEAPSSFISWLMPLHKRR